MEKEELETSQEESTETIDSTNDEEVSETQEVDDDNIPTIDDYKSLQQKNKELYERAKKAEAIAKAKKEATLQTKETQSGLTREEAILYAKGYSDEEVELANKLSKISGTSPLEAINDDYFKAKVDARIKKERSDNASLSPSGKGKFKQEKPYKDMTEEERIAQFNKAMGN